MSNDVELEVGTCAKHCEAGWFSLQESLQRIRNDALKQAVPLLCLEIALEQIETRDPIVVASFLTCGGHDGLVLARALDDVLFSISLALLLAEESVANGLANATRFAQVALQPLLQKLTALLPVVDACREDPPSEESFENARGLWSPVEYLARGDFAAFWANHFPHRLCVFADEFLNALRSSQSLGVVTGSELIEWLKPGVETMGGKGRTALDLNDLAILFDSFGISGSIAFCTAWEQLCGHDLINAVAGVGGADFVQPQQEECSCVVLPTWTKQKLRTSRSLLRSFVVLGMQVACDAEDGLVVQFLEPEIACCLANISGGVHSKFRVAEAVAAMAHTSDSVEVVFDAAGGSTPSACIVAFVQKQHLALSGWQNLYRTLTHLQEWRVWMLNDLVAVAKVLDDRRRALARNRAVKCDPNWRSSAFPMVETAKRELQEMEDHLTSRQERLLQMERACDNPDQISQIRALMQEVAETEERHEAQRAVYEARLATWQEEVKSFTKQRELEDALERQRLHGCYLEIQVCHQRRISLRAELSRVEAMLVELEESIVGNRQTWYDYDQKLSRFVQDKEGLLEGIKHAISQVKLQVQVADATTVQKTKELDEMRHIMELQANKAQQLDDLDVLQKKIDTMKAKRISSIATGIS